MLGRRASVAPLSSRATKRVRTEGYSGLKGSGGGSARKGSVQNPVCSPGMNGVTYKEQRQVGGGTTPEGSSDGEEGREGNGRESV